MLKPYIEKIILTCIKVIVTEKTGILEFTKTEAASFLNTKVNTNEEYGPLLQELEAKMSASEKSKIAKYLS
jgi:hypothetical protein